MSPQQLSQSVRRVAIVGGTRIPFARSDGPYATASNQQMLTAALDGLVERYGLQEPGAVGEFVAGAVLKHSRDFNFARETVLGSRLDPRTPAYDIQQACGTGLQAVIAAANKIALGQTESAIAGGADTASDAPLGVNDSLRRILLEARRAKSAGARLKALAQVRPGHLVPDIPRNAEPRTGLSMGEHAAVTARAWGIPRAAQDELAATSHQRLAAAYERGFFEDLVVPFRGLARDQNLRPGSTVEKLASLKPVFGLGDPDPTMTAGNSTPLTDGAALVLLASEEWAAARGLEPLAYLTAYETAAVDFVARRRGRRRGRTADGPRPRRPAHAGAGRARPGGLRTPRDPRGVRLPGPGDPRRLGEAGPGPGGPRPPQRRGVVAGHRASLRRDRRADRGDPGEAAGRAGRPGTRADLRLRGGRTGGDGDAGAAVERARPIEAE